MLADARNKLNAKVGQYVYLHYLILPEVILHQLDGQIREIVAGIPAAYVACGYYQV